MLVFLLCQRPERAFFISTALQRMQPQMSLCVNALNGLFSFLPSDLYVIHEGDVCQRPERAFFISTQDD